MPWLKPFKPCLPISSDPSAHLSRRQLLAVAAALPLAPTLRRLHVQGGDVTIVVYEGWVLRADDLDRLVIA